MVELNIASDFEPEVKLERKNTDTGAWEAATGLSSVVARISDTKTGSAIGGLTVGLTERGTTGLYAGVFDAADLLTALTTYVGTVVYVVYSKAGDIDMEWEPFLVRNNRRV